MRQKRVARGVCLGLWAMVSVLGSVLGARAEGGTISLSELVAAAQREPPRVLAALAAVKTREAEVSTARGAYLPTFMAQGSIGLGYDNRPLGKDNDGNTIYLDYGSRNAAVTGTADYALVNPARRKAVAATLANREAEERNVADVQRVAVAAAVELYVRALATVALIDDATLTLERRTQQEQAIQSLVRAGLRPGVDATRAQVEAVAARYRLDVRHIEQQAAFAGLAAAVGRNPEHGLVPEPVRGEPFRAPTSASEAISQAIARRPELSRLESRLAARQNELSSVLLRRLPVLGVTSSGSIQRVSPFGHPDFAINGTLYNASGSLYLRWSGLDASLIRGADIARASVVEAQRAFEATVLDVRSQAVDAFYNVQRAQKEMERAVEVLGAAGATRDAQQGRYKAGVASLLDLLDAEALEQNARLARIEALREYDVARVRLLSVVGSLEQIAQ